MAEREQTADAHADPGQTASSGGPPARAETVGHRPWRAGLSGKLLVLTLIFVMMSEILIYVPSIANFRLSWLRDAHATASVAAVVLADGSEVPKALQGRLLASTDTIAIAIHRLGRSGGRSGGCSRGRNRSCAMCWGSGHTSILTLCCSPLCSGCGRSCDLLRCDRDVGPARWARLLPF